MALKRSPSRSTRWSRHQDRYREVEASESRHSIGLDSFFHHVKNMKRQRDADKGEIVLYTKFQATGLSGDSLDALTLDYAKNLFDLGLTWKSATPNGQYTRWTFENESDAVLFKMTCPDISSAPYEELLSIINSQHP